MAEVLNQRFSQPVSMPAYSGTRRQQEQIVYRAGASGVLYAESANGNTYEVNLEERTCTCPDYRYHGGRRPCRHLRGTEAVLGGAGGSDAPDETPVAAPPPEACQAQAEARAAVEALSQEDERRRQEMLEAWRRYQEQFGDAPLISQDEEAWSQLQEMARADQQYQHEEVLGGAHNTFGVEIEFIEGDREAIARELYDLGLGVTPVPAGYHSSGRQPGRWSVERDGSVSQGSRGGEVVSPVLSDTPEAWRQIQVVCEVIRRHGGRIDRRCGAHVHIGAAPLDHRRQAWRRLVQMAAGFEDVLYRIAAGGESQGQLRGTGYAAPVASDYGTILNRFPRIENDGDLQRFVNRANPSRYRGLNLANVGSSRCNTVEFRYFNGTMDPRQIQANVKLASAMVHAADTVRTRGADANTRTRGEMLREQPATPLGTNAVRRADDGDHSAVRRMLDVLFRNPRDMAAVLRYYLQSQWQTIS